MATLAQQFIERGVSYHSSSKESVKSGHLPTLVGEIKQILSHDLIVERFIFPPGAIELLNDQIAQGFITREDMFAGAHAPCENVWLEWWGSVVHPISKLDMPIRYGALALTRSDSGAMMFHFFCQTPKALQEDDSLHALGSCEIEGLPWTGDLTQKNRILYATRYTDADLIKHNAREFNVETDLTDEGYAKELDAMVIDSLRDAVYLMFLLSLPRAVEIVPYVPDYKLQRARAKRGRLPILEHKTVKLNLGVAVKRSECGGYSEGIGGTGPQKRLHRVLGHIRTYREGVCGREAPRRTWVPSHWRGDASLGVVIHDHHITLPERNVE